MKEKFIAFTIDIDWAVEEAIAELLSFFELNKIKATIFATHNSDVLSKCNRDLFEIGLHPNYLQQFDGNGEKTKDIIKKLKDIYPASIGIRAHHGVQSTYHSYLYKEMGFIYESNTIEPYNKNIKPFEFWNGLYRIPFNWEDDVHFMYSRSFEDGGLNPETDNIIYNFHPVHTYLNTENAERYNNCKQYYKDAKMLKEMRNNSDVKGAMDFLKDQIKIIKEKNISVNKLSEIIK